MAEHMHDIKRRIKSISSTERITNAMKLVSASKLRKAKAAYENSRGYMSGVLDDIRGVFEDIEDIPEVFVERSREIKNRCYVLITSSNGLCGSFNSNVIKALEAELARDNAGRDNALLVTIGTKGRDYFLRRGYQLLMTHDAPADTVDYAETRKISEPLIRMYLDGKIDEIKIVYTRYINTLRQEPAAVQLLPVNPSPLLQDSILCHHASHEIVLSMAYCERVSTVSTFRWLVMIGVSVSVQLKAAAAGASQSSLITRRVDFARQRSTDSSPNSNRTTRH